MPELPEVETAKEGIKKYLEGQKIAQIIVRHTKLRLPVALNIDELCREQTVIQVSRRAKYIVIKLSQGYLLIHLGMSGHVRMVPFGLSPGKHDHIDLILSNQGTLRYCDPRRFGLFHYVAEEPESLKLLAHLGPEPLTEAFNADYLYQKSRNKTQAIKSLIMTNELVVGVGNIYATESLFLAGIHPKQPAKTLSYAHCFALTQHIKAVLQAAICAGGTTLKDFYTSDGRPGYFTVSLNVYGRKNLPCLTCHTPIESIGIAGRSSSFCAHCQPLL